MSKRDTAEPAVDYAPRPARDLHHGGVVDREAKYRMWYECYDVEGWPTADDTSFCYAESRDGIHWTKPELGLFEYQGSKKNNILFRQIGDGDHHRQVCGRVRCHRGQQPDRAS